MGEKGFETCSCTRAYVDGSALTPSAVLASAYIYMYPYAYVGMPFWGVIGTRLYLSGATLMDACAVLSSWTWGRVTDGHSPAEFLLQNQGSLAQFLNTKMVNKRIHIVYSVKKKMTPMGKK